MGRLNSEVPSDFPVQELSLKSVTFLIEKRELDWRSSALKAHKNDLIPLRSIHDGLES
ncbi:hypothetical protein GALMADRAFT_229216 [Galerina marginata CBS 339.88]|uniref:Uncharacterized protein n=1 Tax=Galerina marginata (strain CBS 339.88) TaxID=685588 RepID=A0A067SM74_GALM3|nr:hypothetical protein GALMADRAFT_229216 [Galerina marginata CBS 339.88]